MILFLAHPANGRVEARATWDISMGSIGKSPSTHAGPGA